MHVKLHLAWRLLGEGCVMDFTWQEGTQWCVMLTACMKVTIAAGTCTGTTCLHNVYRYLGQTNSYRSELLPSVPHPTMYVSVAHATH